MLPERRYLAVDLRTNATDRLVGRLIAGPGGIQLHIRSRGETEVFDLDELLREFLPHESIVAHGEVNEE